MAIAINGSGTITGISVGGLPDGIVDTDMLAANAVSSGKLASGVGGKVLNYSDVTKSDTQTTLSTSFTDITGLSVTLTPASSASKFLIMYSVFCAASQNVYSTTIQLVKVVGGTASDIHRGDASGNRGRVTAGHWSEYASYDQFNSAVLAGQVIHAPSTTSAVTIKMQFRTNNHNYYSYINRMEADGDDPTSGRAVSNIAVLELGA
tara:strand:- start:153 stop:770 length:618 start_codon:yes stop_codon:yes gene_type:complete